jgi:glycine hydroxymethyltransferase
MLEFIQSADPEIFEAIKGEIDRENHTFELIASENFVSKAVLQTAGSVMTNKYAEGYPGKRYYGGCEWVDKAENLARDRAKELFGAVNFSGKMYKVASYGVAKENGYIDLDDVSRKAKQHKPRLIIVGASAYSRFYPFQEFRQIADEVGAILLADIAHPAGLVATGVHPSPIPYCDVVTTTTHKTLRGPRGGMILIGKDKENDMGIVAPKSGRTKMISEIIDSNVMPGIQGGPLMHVIAAKAVAFKEALQPSFKEYTNQIIKNAQTLANQLIEYGYNVVSGGTENHVMLIDLTKTGITGKDAENALHAAGITVNKNMVPFDERSPFVTSGIRLGTPALTTRGFKETEMKQVAQLIDRVLKNIENEDIYQHVKQEVKMLCQAFPLYDFGKE